MTHWCVSPRLTSYVTARDWCLVRITDQQSETAKAMTMKPCCKIFITALRQMLHLYQTSASWIYIKPQQAENSKPPFPLGGSAAADWHESEEEKHLKDQNVSLPVLFLLSSCVSHTCGILPLACSLISWNYLVSLFTAGGRWQWRTPLVNNLHHECKCSAILKITSVIVFFSKYEAKFKDFSLPSLHKLCISRLEGDKDTSL